LFLHPITVTLRVLMLMQMIEWLVIVNIILSQIGKSAEEIFSNEGHKTEVSMPLKLSSSPRISNRTSLYREQKINNFRG